MKLVVHVVHTDIYKCPMFDRTYYPMFDRTYSPLFVRICCVNDVGCDNQPRLARVSKIGNNNYTVTKTKKNDSLAIYIIPSLKY